MICFPVHSSIGLSTAGEGSSKATPGSNMCDRVDEAWALDRKQFFRVSRYPPVRKSCVAAIIGSPWRAEIMLRAVDIRMAHSARASSVCGRWMFISSPSKSALYGAQQHSLNRKVRYGRTRARWHIIEIRCSDGCLLKITQSPLIRWRSTMSPGSRFSAMVRRSFSESIAKPRFCPFVFFMYTAPGWTCAPLTIALYSICLLFSNTRSGYVMTFATNSGMANSVIFKFGSGEMTVRPEKSTRFPLRCLRKRPSFPFNLCTSPRLTDLVPVGYPGMSESRNDV
eukprot:gene8561-biopygen8550